MNTYNDLPQVMGIMSIDDKKIKVFKEKIRLNFLGFTIKIYYDIQLYKRLFCL